MADEAKHWWEKHGPAFQEDAQHPIAVVYGPYATEDKLQIIGSVAGKHLLEIGCGGAQCGIAFAKQGAVVTGMDIAASQIEYARNLAAREGIDLALLQGNMEDLSPIAPDSQDIVFSASALQYVDDLLACFTEVHRVLKPGGVFVFGVGHPAFLVDKDFRPQNSYFDTGKFVDGLEVSQETGFAFAHNRRTVSGYVNTLVDAGLAVERMVEPDPRPVDPNNPESWKWDFTPDLLATFPATLILRSRKRAQPE